MSKLNIQQSFVPNTLLEDARSELGQEFCDLPLKIQIGYLRVFQGNYIIDKSNRHRESPDSFKLGTEDLNALFGDARKFRAVNNHNSESSVNGYYLRPRATKSSVGNSYVLCRESDDGAVHHEALELITLTLRGCKDPDSGKKGMLSAYQLSDRAKVLMHNRIAKQSRYDRSKRYFLDANGKRIDDKDLYSQGINRSKSNIVDSHKVNTRKMTTVLLPSMLIYKLILNSIEEWVAKFGTHRPDLRKQGKKTIEVPNKVLRVGSKCWYMLYKEVLEKNNELEDYYDSLVSRTAREERLRLEDVNEAARRLSQAIEVEKELHQAADLICGEEGPPTREDALVALDGIKVNNRLSKPLKALLQEDLDLLDIRGQIHELEDLIVILEESNSWRVPIMYDECGTGRYFTGILQGYRKEVRYAAFRGHYAYDIEAAHQNILLQLMKRKGIKFTDLNVMQEYVDNKKEIRERLAKELNTSVPVVKNILQIFTYGSRSSESPQEGLYRCCNGDIKLIKRVKGHQWIQSYRSAFIVALDTLGKSKGRVVNAVGIVIEEEKNHKSQEMAHILQGCERQVLDAIIEHWEFGSIALLLHDCVVFTSRVNPNDITQVVKKETGFTLSFAEERY